MKKDYNWLIIEKFGAPIGSMAGEPMVGVRDERESVCPDCGMMSINGQCGCGESCPHCKEMPVGGSCGCMNESAEKSCDECGMNEEMCECGGMNEGKKKKKGPSKKTAQKILKGTKTFAQKMKKVSGWADDPGAAAAWMMHKATRKWPSEK